MRLHTVVAIAMITVPAALLAQTQPATPQGAAQTQGGRGGTPQGRGGGQGQGRGPNFPQQQRPLADAAVVAITGDLQDIASRTADPRELQNLWLSGGSGGRGGRGRGGSEGRPPTAVVTTAAGGRVEGRLARIDDFIVSIVQDDGTRRTFMRNGGEPKVPARRGGRHARRVRDQRTAVEE